VDPDLGGAPGVAPLALLQPDAPDEQLRRVAILFVDLQGSTALADGMDPELAYRLVSECVAGLGRVVTEAGGYVVKTLGDGLMALFGAPVAHGDDAERAGRAALGMQAWLTEHAARLEAEHGVALRARVGLNFGSVVAAALSAGGRPEYDVLGDAVNVAQRIEAAAEPGTVCVSEAFYRVTRGVFEYRHRGVAQVKGKAEPLELYALIGPLPPERRAAAVFPLVGRADLLAEFRAALREVVGGRSLLLGMAGTGGMGKTRLLGEFAGELAAHGLPVLHGSGVDAEQRGPLALWRAWLGALLPLPQDTGHAAAAAAIREALTRPDDLPWAEWLAALAVEPHRLLTLDADSRELTVRRALEVFVAHWQQGSPAAILVDEADLLDALSLRLLEDLARAGPGGAPLLVVLAGRVTEVLSPGTRVLPLEPLDAPAAHLLVREALGGAPDSALATRLVERAGGSPLFLTLILQAARESADPAAALAAVPDSLYGLIQAQLDALAEGERRVAQTAAVLGRSFAEQWLETLCGRVRPPAPWRALERRGLLEEHRPAPGRELAFRHGALQEVLYEGLLGATRREVHARAAAVISAQAGGRPELAARVAHHWRAAEEWDEALEWGLRAAEHSAALFAGEAEAGYGECIRLAESLGRPEAGARARVGLAELKEHQGEFREGLALAEAAADLASAEAGDLRPRILLARARMLGRTGAAAAALPLLQEALATLGSDPAGERLRTRCRVEEAHACCDLGRLAEAEASALLAEAAAEEAGWTAEAAAAASALGRIYPLLGNWPAGEARLRRAAALAEGAGNWKEAAGCWINLGSGLQAAGRLREAAEAQQHALSHARRIGDAEKGAIIEMNLGTVLLSRGDWEGAEEACRSALTRFEEMDHALGAAFSRFNLVEALRLAGRREAAAEEFERLRPASEQVDSPQLAVHIAVTEAELALAAGDAAAAAAAARQAADRAGELGYESGLCHARLALGRALRAAGQAQEAQEALTAAVEGFAALAEELETARARAELAAAETMLGHRHAARRLRREARAALRGIGAEGWLERIPA